MGYLKGVSTTASIGLLVLTGGCAGSLVPGAVVPALARPSLTAIVSDPRRRWPVGWPTPTP